MATAFMIIDAQRNMLEGDEQAPDASQVRQALATVLARARATSTLVIHVQNDGPAGLGAQVVDLDDVIFGS